MASRKRNRAVHVCVLSPIQEESVTPTANIPESVVEEEVNELFLGGPEDPSILKSFKTHIALAIWMQQERPPLKCMHHKSKLTEWVWSKEGNNIQFSNIIIESGLSELATCSYREPRSSNLLLQELREKLDWLSANEVEWNPYTHEFHEVTFYTGCIKCLDKIEPYHPERVLRQFDLVQTIPPDPLLSLRVKSRTISEVCTIWDQSWDKWDSHLLSSSARGEVISYPSECCYNYLDWFGRISHVMVQHPCHLLNFSALEQQQKHAGSSSHIDFETVITT
ncbi:hypothetical protein Dsin_000061 [Dipteronia sinensis]|uniref:Aminotransferase-like plant mobile domain-containing protein n=1 Tax=Dipteronia sinensis TaxID=43782 RepID=A0AAD9Z2K7_9ROSI|nr:hypothetical protein Dsin_000061 [Dipteronia sinensis]